MTELNLKKELETYFYHKGYGSESAQEAADMTAFLRRFFNERLKDIEFFNDTATTEIYTLRTSLFWE